MATIYFPQASTSGPNVTTDPAILRAAAAPTTSYVATTNDVVVMGYNEVVFGIDYVNGDEASIQAKAQGFDGTTWRDLTFKATQASAVAEVTPDGLNLTKATFSTAYGAGVVGNVALPPCVCRGFQKVRMVVKSTGGTPTGTIAVSVTGSIIVTG